MSIMRYCTSHSGSDTFFVLTDFFNPEWSKTDQIHNKNFFGHSILTADVRTTVTSTVRTLAGVSEIE